MFKIVFITKVNLYGEYFWFLLLFGLLFCLFHNIFVCHIITFFLFVPTASVTQTLQKLCVVVRPKKQQVIHFYFYFQQIFFITLIH